MRTTLTVDDDVLQIVRDRAAREGRSVGAVLSELARDALNARAPHRAAADFYGFHPLPSRGPPVTNALIDRLREDEGE